MIFQLDEIDITGCDRLYYLEDDDEDYDWDDVNCDEGVKIIK